MNTERFPSIWITKQTANVFEQISTSKKKVKTKDCKPSGKFPVVDQGQQFISGYIDDEEKLIKVTKPLVIFGDHTRIVKWVPMNFVPGADGTKILVPKDYLEPKFFYYQIKSLELPDKGYARHFKFLKESIFAVPPFAEQQEIAARLDIMLAQVDTIKGRLDALPAILKRFRQSVLTAAVSGKLTEKWRENNKLSEALNKPLAEILEIASGVAFKKSQYSVSGSRLLQISNVGYGEVLWVKEAFIPLNLADDNSRFSLISGDIVVALNRPITNGWLKVAMVSSTDLPATLYQRVARIRAKNPSDLSTAYCFLAMRTENFKKQVELNLKGSDQPYINTSSLAELSIPLPSLEEQTEIVRRVEQLFAFADKVEQRVNDAQSRVNHLTQSILAKAFRGELTADWRQQHPELIRGEHSAEALLARIQAERAAQASAKRGRKKAG